MLVYWIYFRTRRSFTFFGNGVKHLEISNNF